MFRKNVKPINSNKNISSFIILQRNSKFIPLVMKNLHTSICNYTSHCTSIYT